MRVFPLQNASQRKKLLENIDSGSLFRIVLCEIEVPEKLREAFANCPPISKKINVSRDEIGPFLEEYAEKAGLLTHFGRMLKSSSFLENRTIIPPFLLFYLDLGLVCQRIYHFALYTAIKCFNNFGPSAVNARRKEDEKPIFNVVAGTIKLLANSSYGYQILHRSRHTITKFLSDGKANGTINYKTFRRLGFIKDQQYEM